MSKTALWVAKIGIGIGLCWVLWDRGLLRPGALAERFAAHPHLAVGAALLHGVVFWVMGLRWRIVARTAGLHLGRFEAFRLTLISLGISTCLPGNGAGDLAKGWVVTDRDHPFPKILGTMAIDRWSGITGMFLSWTLWSAFSVVQGGSLSLIGRWTLLVGALCSLGCLMAGFWSAQAERWLPQVEHRWLVRPMAFLRTTLASVARSSTDRRLLVRILAISLAAQIMIVGVGLLCAGVLDLSLPATALGVLLPTTMIGNSLPLSPGGVGVGESIGALGFSRLGLRASTGSETILVLRFASGIWAIPGLVSWMLWKRRHPGSQAPEEGLEANEGEA
ncbi:MAG TPA: lysylphosphatidylglycerol synthase transmembrane domain-containing protein [Fibrobacteria bacterium]|nr:lysylphosphatidylglycerol synthase transmembrane domain-containing protein [Fibrobacteria bacterium]HOX52867.1 lysylphosphatidylglycerol synthase transmembrane domain-containing protein [Fibrobacteria bacterium]